MTVGEIRKEVMKSCSNKKEIKLWLQEAEREEVKLVTVKIIAFYPAHVLIEKNGFKVSYSYFEILKMLVPQQKEKRVHIKKDRKKEYQRSKFK